MTKGGPRERGRGRGSDRDRRRHRRRHRRRVAPLETRLRDDDERRRIREARRRTRPPGDAPNAARRRRRDRTRRRRGPFGGPRRARRARRTARGGRRGRSAGLTRRAPAWGPPVRLGGALGEEVVEPAYRGRVVAEGRVELVAVGALVRRGASLGRRGTARGPSRARVGARRARRRARARAFRVARGAARRRELAPLVRAPLRERVAPRALRAERREAFPPARVRGAEPLPALAPEACRLLREPPLLLLHRALEHVRVRAEQLLVALVRAAARGEDAPHRGRRGTRDGEWDARSDRTRRVDVGDAHPRDAAPRCCYEFEGAERHRPHTRSIRLEVNL